MQRLKIDFEYNALATAADLAAKKKEDKPYKSVIIVTGASLKGMGAAGVSVDDELARTKALIEEARKQGITVIGSHIEVWRDARKELRRGQFGRVIHRCRLPEL